METKVMKTPISYEQIAMISFSLLIPSTLLFLLDFGNLLPINPGAYHNTVEKYFLHRLTPAMDVLLIVGSTISIFWDIKKVAGGADGQKISWKIKNVFPKTDDERRVKMWLIFQALCFYCFLRILAILVINTLSGPQPFWI